MSLWTAIKARLEGQTAYAPAAIAAFAAAGIKVNADGAVVMPDGTTGTFDPTTGIISLADGTDVALPAYDPTKGQTHDNPATKGVPIDLSEWAREGKGAAIGAGLGAVVGVALGMSFGPLGMRIGAAIVSPVGAWIGWKVG